MNALYLKDLSRKTRRGLRGRVLQGRIAGENSYGYDVVREVDSSGEPIRGGRTVNEAQAEGIRRIYREFASGASPRAIARGLNADGIPGPKGNPWSDGTIRGHRASRLGILHNELYNGRIVWNRQRYVTDPRTGKKKVKSKSRERMEDPGRPLIFGSWSAISGKPFKLASTASAPARASRRDAGNASGNIDGPRTS